MTRSDALGISSSNVRKDWVLEPQQLHVRVRHHRGGAGAVVDQGHLPHHGPRPRRRHVLPPDVHAGGAVDDDEAVGPGVALVHQHGARRCLHLLGQVQHAMQLVVGEALEEGHVGQPLDTLGRLLPERHQFPPSTARPTPPDRCDRHTTVAPPCRDGFSGVQGGHTEGDDMRAAIMRHGALVVDEFPDRDLQRRPGAGRGAGLRDLRLGPARPGPRRPDGGDVHHRRRGRRRAGPTR